MRAKKISISTKYLLMFSELDGKKVKQIIVGLLSGDLEQITDKESLVIAKIISSENNTLSEIRRNAKFSNMRSSKERVELSTQSYPHSQQSAQSAQNQQVFPLASPFQRMTKNYNNNLISTHEGKTEKTNQNCFSQHLVNCARVPIRTESERKIYVDVFQKVFDDIEEDKGYHISPDDDKFDMSIKIAHEQTKQAYIKAMFEIVDTFIEMSDRLKTAQYIHCGKDKLFGEDIGKMALMCDYEHVLKKVLYQLAINPEGITNHPYYILCAIWKNVKEKNRRE